MYRPSKARVVLAIAVFALITAVLYAIPIYAISYAQLIAPAGLKFSVALSPMLMPAALFLALSSALTVAFKGLKGLLTILTGVAGITYVYAIFNGGTLVVQTQLPQLQAQALVMLEAPSIMYAFMAVPVVLLVKGVFDAVRRAKAG